MSGDNGSSQCSQVAVRSGCRTGSNVVIGAGNTIGGHHSRELEVMIKFYFSPAPNPTKVALFLEEAGLPYEVVPVDTRKGDQFKPEFLALNPNAKVPVIVDGDVRVFDSNAILL